MLKMKKITETYDMRVYTDSGDYFGDVEDGIEEGRIRHLTAGRHRRTYEARDDGKDRQHQRDHGPRVDAVQVPVAAIQFEEVRK